MKKRNLGPIDPKPCETCGKRHHQYSWPQKCYEASVRKEYLEDLRYDREAYREMSQVERDAHDNL